MEIKLSKPVQAGVQERLTADMAVQWGPARTSEPRTKRLRKLGEKIDWYVCMFEAPGVFVAADRLYRPIARFRKPENAAPVFIEYVHQNAWIKYYAQLWLFNDGTDDKIRAALREHLQSLLPKIPPPSNNRIFVEY